MLLREERRDAVDSVTRLIHLYAHQLDGADFDGLAELLSRATWRISPELTCSGREEIHRWLLRNLTVHGDRLGTRHIMCNLLVDVAEDGQTATSMSYGIVTQVTEDFPLQVISQYRYEDTFALDGEDWHFIDRRVLLDGYGDLRAHQAADALQTRDATTS